MSTTATSARNGNAEQAQPQPDPLTHAIEHEQTIAEEAAAIRGDSVYLDEELFLNLWPLLRRPIPAGFIVTTEAVRGKPYESTGIKSLQVQIDRMDNVLTPLNWSWYTEWSEEGRIADVTVRILAGGGRGEDALVVRRARGGVNQASTDGNLYKGSETNAAKLALARVGVGHEIYLGASDFDPDVDKSAAEIQTATERVETIDSDRALHLRELFDGNADLDAKKLQIKLGALGVTSARSVNAGIASLTPGQADELEGWLKGGEQS